MNKSLAEIREEYKKSALRRSDMLADPIAQFDIWFDDAVKHNSYMANAMTLATASADGRPCARTVLLKDFDAHGFVFFTNYLSRKGRELEENPQCTLLFWWADLERQVRIEGTAEKVSADESRAYFESRPRGAQLSAAVSPQSEIVEHRHVLENRVAAFEKSFAKKNVPRPEHWGGYRVAPNLIEFWQGRENRLHDRICYQKCSEKEWVLRRLAP